MSPRRSPSRICFRPGYTLLELLLASMVTALVAGSSAAFLSAVTNASMTTRDIRGAQTTGHYALGQINRTIRAARAIGQVTTSTITVWLGDYNKDDKMNLYETGIIYYDATGKQILFDYMEIPTSGMPATTVTTAEFTNYAALSARMANADKRTVSWAGSVSSLGFTANTATTDARMIESAFNIDLNLQSASFRGSASTRGSSDYLFYSQTQTAPPFGSGRRARFIVSRWDGYSALVGKSTPLNLN